MSNTTTTSSRIPRPPGQKNQPPSLEYPPTMMHDDCAHAINNAKIATRFILPPSHAPARQFNLQATPVSNRPRLTNYQDCSAASLIRPDICDMKRRR